MNTVRAILVDSLRESVDHKAMVILVALAVIMAALMSGVSFEERPVEDMLHGQIEHMRNLRYQGYNRSSSSGLAVDVSAIEARRAHQGDGLEAAFDDGYVLVVRFDTDGDIDDLTCRWWDFREKGITFSGSSTTRSTTEEERRACLEERLRHEGWTHVRVDSRDAPRPTYRIALAADDLADVTGAHIKHQMYGLMDPFVMRSRSKNESVVESQLGMANDLMGYGGILITILITAGFIPSMLRKGSLDLILARPIGRGRLLLTKYLGGIWFIVLVSTILIVLCWLCFALRQGSANPVFFMVIPILTLCFAVVYSISTLFAVTTRSGTLSALVAIAVWVVAAVIYGVRTSARLSGEWEGMPGWARGLIETLYTVLPKTADLLLLNKVALSRSHLSEAGYARSFANQIPDVDWFFSMGTTAGFVALMLGLAVWKFRRQDH